MWGLVSITLLTNHILGSLLTVLWLFRIYKLNIKHFFIFNLILLIVPLAVFINYQKDEIARETIIQQHSKTAQLIDIELQPDDIKHNNQSVYGIGYSPTLKQKINYFGFIKSKKIRNSITTSGKKIAVKVVADLSRIENSPNVNQFDKRKFYKQQGVIGQVKINQIESIHVYHKLKLSDYLHWIRFNGIRSTSDMPKTLSTYAQSLLFGQKNNDFKETMSGIKQLGLMHLFSISGMHVYLLIDLLSVCFTFCYFKRESINWLIMLLLPCYFIIAGTSIGLLRVILIVETKLGLTKLRFRLSKLDIWSFALMINLLVNPTLLSQFGCQLSYLLSFTLIYTNKMSNLKRTIIINLIGLPLILFNFYEWHVLSLAANLFIIPFFSVVIFPITIIGYFLAVFKLPFVNFINKFLEMFSWLMDSCSNLPGKIVFGKPTLMVCLLMIVIVLFIIEKGSIKAYLCFGLLILTTFLFIHFPITGQVIIFDVGQGDSILLKEPFNRSITLIDTGGKPNFFAKKGQKTIYLAPETSINYLKSIGINHIDNICLSHQDADHIGDLPSFLKTMNVKNVYIPYGMHNNKNFMNKIKPFLKQTSLKEVKDGNNIVGTNLHVIHPFKKGTGKNEDSMVIFSSIGNFNWLFTGDLNQAEEIKILKKYPELRTDILKLGHHGSKTASNPEFIKSIQAKIGIISAGRNNRYGHPNKETLDTLQQNNVKTISTQKSGMIMFKYLQNHTGSFTTKWEGDHNGDN